MTGVLPEPGGGGTCISGSTPRGGRMTPLERSSRSLRSSAGGACPSVSVFGVRSRSDMVGCPHASAIIVAATMPADIHVSAMVARATAVSFPVRFTNRTHANTIGFHCARFGRPPGTGRKQKIFQRLHNPVTLPYRLAFTRDRPALRAVASVPYPTDEQARMSRPALDLRCELIGSLAVTLPGVTLMNIHLLD